jgi:hypothetical protein
VPPTSSQGGSRRGRDPDDAAMLDHPDNGVVSSLALKVPDRRTVGTRHHGRFPSPSSPASIAASFARSAGESFASAAASSASPRTRSCPTASLARLASSDVPAFAFSASLVQTLVQTAASVVVSLDPTTPCDVESTRSHRGCRGFKSLIAHLDDCTGKQPFANPGKTGVCRFLLRALAAHFVRLLCRKMCRSFAVSRLGSGRLVDCRLEMLGR